MLLILIVRHYCLIFHYYIKILKFYYLRFSEVFKALNKTRGLYLRWNELQDDSVCITKDEVEWTNTELKNSLRSIEWDLEDLEDTIDILFMQMIFCLI